MMSKIEFPYQVIEVDLDTQPALVAEYDIKSVPTLVLLDNNDNEVQRSTGMPNNKIQFIEEFVTRYE